MIIGSVLGYDTSFIVSDVTGPVSYVAHSSLIENMLIENILIVSVPERAITEQVALLLSFLDDHYAVYGAGIVLSLKNQWPLLEVSVQGHYYGRQETTSGVALRIAPDLFVGDMADFPATFFQAYRLGGGLLSQSMVGRLMKRYSPQPHTVSWRQHGL